MFTAIFNQTVFLFAFIALGFFFVRRKLFPENSIRVLSKLENYLFIPALVGGTFIQNCTVAELSKYWKLLLMSIALLALFIPLALFFARLFFKEPYLRKIAAYGLTFSNFAYMGNAVVAGVFGQKLFAEYLVFCLPIWLCVYLWGVPALLVPSERAVKKPKPTLKNRLQSFCNPMLVCTAIGILLGLTGLGAKLPTSILSVVDSAGACMSPIAMLLTGFAIGEIDLKKVFSRRVLYLFSAVKLLLFPLAFLLVFGFLPRTSFLSKNFLLCGACVASMPMGLNAIVIPAGYGKDTAEASAMTLVTHLFSVLTVPLFFALFQAFF